MKKAGSIKWPACNPQLISVDELKPYANNSRTHSVDQIAQIADSIREWGFTNPILIDENKNIIAGHGRLMAAERLRLEQVPCIIAEGWTEKQKKAYVIADNKLALNAGWDIPVLKMELANLDTAGFNLKLTGFSVSELGGLFNIEPDNGASEKKKAMVKCPHCGEEFAKGK